MKRKWTATSRRKASSSRRRPGQPSARFAPHPPAPRASTTVEIVFAAVRGRARLHVSSIRRQPLYAARLAARIAAAPGVREGHATPTAGNVLGLSDVGRLALSALIAAGRRHAAEARNGHAPAPRRVDSDWHTLSATAVVKRLGADVETGFASDEAVRRLAAL